VWLWHDGAMARAKQDQIDENQVQGFKFLKKLLPMLDQLHGVACERDRANNRKLHFDHYILLMSVFFFNPIV
jgi:hypothetical protein